MKQKKQDFLEDISRVWQDAFYSPFFLLLGGVYGFDRSIFDDSPGDFRVLPV